LKEYIVKRPLEAFDVKKEARVLVRKSQTVFLNAGDKSTKKLLQSGLIVGAQVDVEIAVSKAVSKAKSSLIETPDMPDHIGSYGE